MKEIISKQDFSTNLIKVPTSISVVQLDVQSKRSARECLVGDEGVCESGLLLGLHLPEVGQRSEVLDVVCVVHGVTEGGLHRLNNVVFRALVDESHEELHRETGLYICGEKNTVL